MSDTQKQKRRFGDRKDGTLLRDLDGMHFITPLIYPNRCDNEAYISHRVDLGPIHDYLAEKNREETQFPIPFSTSSWRLWSRPSPSGPSSTASSPTKTSISAMRSRRPLW